MTGSGTWTYPDPSVIIGLVLQVTAVSDDVSVWGSSILRYRSPGVYAAIDEAGQLHAQPIWNATEVTYDIGKSPQGLAWDLANDVTVTATEILSETPPTGGGGGTGVIPTVQYDSDTAVSVPSSTWTLLVPNLIDVHSDDTVLLPDGAGGVHVESARLCLITSQAWFDVGTTAGNLLTSIYVNGSSFFTAGGNYEPVTPGYWVNLSYVWSFSAGDHVQLYGYHDIGSSQNVYPQYTISALGTVT